MFCRRRKLASISKIVEVSPTNPVDHRAEYVSYRCHHEEQPDGMCSRPKKPDEHGLGLGGDQSGREAGR